MWMWICVSRMRHLDMKWLGREARSVATKPGNGRYLNGQWPTRKGTWTADRDSGSVTLFIHGECTTMQEMSVIQDTWGKDSRCAIPDSPGQTQDCELQGLWKWHGHLRGRAVTGSIAMHFMQISATSFWYCSYQPSEIWTSDFYTQAGWLSISITADLLELHTQQSPQSLLQRAAVVDRNALLIKEANGQTDRKAPWKAILTQKSRLYSLSRKAS